MTWSPFFTEVTPAPTSTTTPAPSCPRIAGNSPSGSAPERVNSSVWQMPVALISTSTSPAFGPSSRTVSIVSGAPALCDTAARTSIAPPLRDANIRTNMKTTTGRAAFLQLLVDEGVTHLFGNPGTTELAIMEVVPDFQELQFVLGLQEASVLAMADGFCRASGRLA